ncbi:MAG TPA: DNA mismatch repair protein MutS [Terriglobales bacterium]|nr:DNA mismatch repair protein MutS [Terriglobales bacterium]
MLETAQTPLMRQYLEVKRQHPEALLLFRLGDFYELFYEDAVTAARELEITLTARNKEKGAPVPMCGVPYHAAENYIARLIQKGFKVAICDQVEDPKLAKKLVRREVTRVLTPGTAALAADAQGPRYLAAVAREEAGFGLAVLDLATGEFHATEFAGDGAAARCREELEQWQPKEILYASEAPLLDFAGERGGPAAAPFPAGATLTPLEDWIFSADFALHELESHFGVLSLEAYGLAGHAAAARAAGAIVHYVKETQRSQIAHVHRIGFYERQNALVLDAATVRTLELVEPAQPGEAGETTLRAALDATLTPMGRRLLRAWLLRPAIERTEIEARWDAVSVLAPATRRGAVRAALAGILDLERLLGRASLATATPRDLEALRLSLDRVPGAARAASEAAAAPAAGRLPVLAAALDDLPALRARLAASLIENPPPTAADGGYIRAGVSAELDELRGLSHDAKRVLAALEARERARTGIASLKVRFNGVFGYFIEVSRPNLPLVPPDYERKQTLVNAERFTTAELKELEVKILSADEKARELEARLFAELRAEVVAAAAPVRQTAAALAELDVLANFAELAATRGYTRPQWADDDTLEIRGGRHPVVERMTAADRFVPNDTYLDAHERVAIVTGPNMGGKSTYLRQVALIAIMAQMGSFVPAERARLCLFDRIFTRIGAGDNLARGRSTFMVEMIETAVILNAATPRSLVVLDEIGRGTATYDGLALAWAVVEHLHGVNGAKTLVATHFHELTALAEQLPGVRNLHVAAKDTPAGIVFLRKVEPGAADRSYGIEVAKLAGLPPAVLARARAVLASHERAEQRASGELGGAAPASLQLTLFTPLTQRIVERIAALDLDHLTPLEAMNLLAELQKQLAANR